MQISEMAPRTKLRCTTVLSFVLSSLEDCISKSSYLQEYKTARCSLLSRLHLHLSFFLGGCCRSKTIQNWGRMTLSKKHTPAVKRTKTERPCLKAEFYRAFTKPTTRMIFIL
uniref:Uncharacterized protein n=1 Tax=Opuntia streptacantha TaxID=393608 RepID=A0A7C9CM84_OPUST